MPYQQNTSWLKDLLFLSLIMTALFFILLGTRPLFVPDEGRYAEIAHEMVASGDYVTPYLNGIKYFEKPVLFYWLESAAIQLGGLNLWSIRSVNALLGLLGCLLTYCTARSLYNRNTGLLAALILGTSTLYFVMVHMISLDLPVTIFLAMTFYGFLQGIKYSAQPVRRYYLWAAAMAAACAVLTKGLIGIVFPAMIVFCWIAVMGEWRLLSRLYLPSCIGIFLLITVPWHFIVGQRNPEFFYFYFIKQHFLRYTTLKIGHYQPVWFFIPAMIAGFFPWIVFLPQTLAKSVAACWRDKHKNQYDLFFLLWAIVIFIFFSISKSKLIPYILPIFPPLAILTARYLDRSIQEKTLRGIKNGLLFLLIAALGVSIVFFLFPRQIQLPNPQMAMIYLYSSAAILLSGTFIVCYFLSRQIYKTLAIMIVTAYLFLLLAFASMPYVDTRSILPLAKILTPLLNKEDEVVAYNQYFQDLPFYLQRRITILNWRNELTYGMEHQDTREWMIKDKTFWQRWHSDKRLFVIMGKKEYQNFILKHAKAHPVMVGETLTNVLISNHVKDTLCLN